MIVIWMLMVVEMAYTVDHSGLPKITQGPQTEGGNPAQIVGEVTDEKNENMYKFNLFQFKEVCLSNGSKTERPIFVPGRSD